MDIVLALVTLVLLSPLLLAISIAIRFTSGKPVIFRQWRVGRYGREFQLLKFRTMAIQPLQAASLLTRAGDPRVTAIGRWLRRSKLDELPQFVNVLRGEMSLVGPRPDLSDFWRQAPAGACQALALVPGLTGAASIAFHREEDLLARVSLDQIARFYSEELLPVKARIDLQYAARATFVSDCRLLLETLTVALGIGPGADLPRTVHESLSR